MKYYVKFNFKDLQNKIQFEKKIFNSEKEARKFYSHIVKTTEMLKKQYGNFGICHYYFNIKMGEI